jgi:HAD superfamily hydrolase (TIGR01509 family)
MPGFDSIFFDFDGVLVDSEPIHCACWAEVLKPLGVTLEWECYRSSYIGIDDRDMLRALASAADPPRDWEELWARYPAKRELFRSRMLGAPPIPDTMADLLDSWNGRYRLAVVSSSSLYEIEPILETGGLRRFFHTIVGGGDVARQKPDPEPYLLAAQRLGSRRALVLEDSAAGMTSARAAGFEVIPVTHPTKVPDLVRNRLAAG